MCSFIVIALLKFNAQTCWAWSTLDLLYKEQVRFRDIVINQMFKALKWRLSSWIQVRNAVLPPVVLKKTFYFRETKHLKRQASPRRRWLLPGRLRSSREKGRWWPRKRKWRGEVMWALQTIMSGEVVGKQAKRRRRGVKWTIFACDFPTQTLTKVAHRKHIYCAPQGGEAIGTVHSYPHTFRKSGVYL